MIEAIGDDNIVVSTDYPHSDGLFPKAIEEFVHLEGVSDKTKSKILWDNCARLYNLRRGRRRGRARGRRGQLSALTWRAASRSSPA